MQTSDLYSPPETAEDLKNRYAMGERNFGARMFGGSRPVVLPEKSNLERAELRDVNLHDAQMRYANLQYADLRGAELVTANLECADLRGADLRGASLVGANLSGANLMFAQLRGAVLLGADLRDADLHAVSNARYDWNKIRGARFSARARDPWSILRRQYSGPHMAFHLFILLVFLLPYVISGLLWSSLSGMEGPNSAERINGWIEDSASRAAVAADVTKDAGLLTLAQWLSHTKLQPVKLWRIILGVDKGWQHWLPAVVLILYNFCRLLLTYFVGPLRDDEERSGVTPSWADYGWLLWPHRIFSILLYFAGVRIVYELVTTLTSNVYLPIGGG